jgi:hypothetical protein
MKLKDILKEMDADYRGDHTSPDKDSGAPLHDVTNVYPDDIYTHPDAARYYGMRENDGDDQMCVSIIRHYHNRPNGLVKIYRAIPSVLTIQDKINRVEAEKRYILKHGKIPPTAPNTGKNTSQYYEFLNSELERLGRLPNIVQKKTTINPGDWVTISRAYAKSHGESNLLGDYKILSKTVKASQLFTAGDALQEWGYHP